LGIQPK